MSAKVILMSAFGVLLFGSLIVIGLLPSAEPLRATSPAAHTPAHTAAHPRVVPTVACGNVSFTRTDYSACTWPNGVAVGDFNDDGILDLVVVSYDTNGTVVILIGNGDGTFRPATSFPAGFYPRSITLGDFNRDGQLDLVTGSEEGSPNLANVNLLAGTGAGTLSPPTPLAGSVSADGLSVSDFNHDGKLDLVYVNSYQGSVVVQLGNGDGTFAPAQSVLGSNNAQGVVAADVDGDGTVDLVVATTATVMVLHGNGDGTFASPATYPGMSYTIALAVGDLNNDGQPDVVLTVANVSGGDGVAVLLNNGSGHFGAPQFYRSGAYPMTVAIGDFNGDGKPDLSVGNSDSHDVSILLGYGDGNFAAPVTLPDFARPTAVALADLNNDGKLDIVVASTDSYSLTVLLNNCVPSLTLTAGPATQSPTIAPASATPSATRSPIASATAPLPTLTATPPATVPASATPSVTGSPTAPVTTPLPTLTAAPATQSATIAPASATPSITQSPTTAPAEATPSATPCTVQFSDVAPSDYFYGAVRALVCRGVVSGYSAGSFRPYAETTRAQLAKIIVLGFDLPLQTPPAGSSFADVTPDSVFRPYVETLAARGIVGGYTCGSSAAEPCNAQHQRYYRPSVAVRRDQLAKIVVGAAGWPLVNPAGGRFVDVPPGSTSYAWVETAATHGILSGYSDGTFRPTNGALRGQIAKLVYGATP